MILAVIPIAIKIIPITGIPELGPSIRAINVIPKHKLISEPAIEIKVAHFLIVEPIFISPKIKNAYSLKPYAKNAGLKLLCGTKSTQKQKPAIIINLQILLL